ncbi:TetR/AcrR family transcriptional regulator [Gemmatimonas sp.]|jgi:AcrR family transcriptional regulator|uniref:TetR/AcrR family transcriptional regulator n=1 Tax=Gemmatimonas sp. TaxID=1962908 RepID=UPI0037BE298B
MTEDHRQRILQAAARVYTQHGWRGATTRRIAEEAGVNEVTLFRHFGSKDALLEQMMRDLVAAKEQERLPDDPREPEAELYAWARAHHSETCGMRPLIRQMMSDLEERPDLAPCAVSGPHSAMMQLRRYVHQLYVSGYIDHDNVATPTEIEAAVTMFMGAVFADGMNRDVMPMMFTQPVEDTVRAYVRLFLRGLHVLSQPAVRAPLVAPESTLTAISE